jgi:hypothetical protein
MSPRIVSFSLYGSIPLYTLGAIRNAELAHSIYPGWIARFYVDDTVPENVVAALRDRQAQIVNVSVPSRGPCYGRYWRFWIADEPGIERFIVRDADSRLNSRELAAVEEWIKSGKSFHVMRDAAGHNRRMIAGMWGTVGGALPNIREDVNAWGRYSLHGENDQFLSTVIYPKIRNDCLCHDSFCHFDDALPFPPHAPLRETRFVCDVVLRDADNTTMLGSAGQATLPPFKSLAAAGTTMTPQQVSRSDIRDVIAQSANRFIHDPCGPRVSAAVKSARDSFLSAGFQFPPSDDFVSFIAYADEIQRRMIRAGLLNDATHLSVHLDYLAKKARESDSNVLANDTWNLRELIFIDAISNITAELSARHGGYGDLLKVTSCDEGIHNSPAWQNQIVTKGSS